MTFRTFVLYFVLMGGITMPPGVSADPPSSGADTSPPANLKSIAADTPAALEAAATKASSSPEELAAFADMLEKAYGQAPPPEGVRMLIAIARGSKMGPGEGWFGPAQCRYSWKWLAQLHGVDPSAAISREAFRGPEEYFARFDRNQNGEIRGDDLDWSDRNPYVRQTYMINRMFRRMDRAGDGRVTRDDWLAYFDRISGGADTFLSEDLRDALLGVEAGFAPGDAPTTDVLLRGLFRGEVGSLNEGPGVDERAPDFQLRRQDGSGAVRLSEKLGSKPVVLVFGNFTCGPFRSMYPMVDELSRRYQDEATFLAIYVREAHPTDGWQMASNANVGVEVAQPTSFDERTAVAQQCSALLNYSMPLLVDEIHDPVGNAYSGMPARLYVIDAEGKVAYKSGRGPFGFKSGEMDQALLMTLIDAGR